MGGNNMRRDQVLPHANPPKTRSACAEVSFFNVMMAATYFRRAARTRHPDVLRGIGREYLAKVGRASIASRACV